MSTDTKKKNKKKKPLRRAQHWGSEVLPMAGKLLVLLIIVCVLGLMFSALQAMDSMLVRVVLSLIIILGILALCLNDGVSKGAQDAASSRAWDTAAAAGRSLTAKDDAACYHPLKALCAALLVFGVFIVMGAYVGLTAEEYTYTMQDLPTWLMQSYGSRGDVMDPLGAYSVETGMQAKDWVRLVVRLPLLIFINLFGDPLKMSAMIDKLSAPMIALYPLAFVIGYLFGPRVQRKVVRANKRAKKIAVRKASKSTLVEELLGEQNQVHYGHQREEPKKKRKELV
ncbi:MAG: hypothetical protein Q4A66_12975 [Eubacteriales bacterium]|nr:hypothetical protein [Eubacteriales bacterium]